MKPEKGDTRLQAWGLMIFLGFIWGSSFILMKKGLHVFPPLEVAMLRMFTAFLCIVAFSWNTLRKFTGRQLLLVSLSGTLSSFMPAILFCLAGVGLDSAVSGGLNAMTPFFTVMVSALIFRSPITWRHGFGLSLGLLGCLVLALSRYKGSGMPEVNFYALYVLLATLFYGMNINLVKHYLSDIEPAKLAVGAFSAIGIPAGLLLFFSGNFLHTLTTNPEAPYAAGMVIVLGVFGSALSLVLFNRLIQISTTLFAGSSTYLIPVFAIFWGIIDGEHITAIQFAGICTVLAGVMFVTRDKR
ncbi:MAG: DMT family transporter [Bacteroidota bacterium]